MSYHRYNNRPKIAYESKDMASDALYKMSLDLLDTKNLRTYQCPGCHYFHIGHMASNRYESTHPLEAKREEMLVGKLIEALKKVTNKKGRPTHAKAK